MEYGARVSDLKGIGDKTYQLFWALDAATFGKLLYHFPRTYFLYPAPIEDADCDTPHKAAVYCRMIKGVTVKRTRRMDLAIARTSLKTADLEIIWFRMPYIKNQVLPGKHYVFYGNFYRERDGVYKLEQPVVFNPEEYDRLTQKPQPVYALTKGLSNNAVKKAVRTLFAEGGPIEEYLPEDILKKRGLVDLKSSLWQIHFPDSFETLTEARRRLVYDEFFDFFWQMKRDVQYDTAEPNPWDFSQDAMYQRTKASLPFRLTAGQEETIGQIREDLAGGVVTQRLIQGDVGSGKTILAFLLMVLAAENGYQSAIMAPTEVLAAQHYETFVSYIRTFELPFQVVLVTGSVTGKKRQAINERIASERSLMIIGTHALVTEKMQYHDLALVVTDEQHRFGVKQRKLLAEKGNRTHVIVMSATPIPRTLAMILYGDMAISVIKDVPAKRLPIKNSVVKKNKQRAAWKFIKDEVEKGHQAYIICPLVEASEKTESENVTEYARALAAYYGKTVRVGFLHGRMRPEEKDEVMRAFSVGETDVLVSTTVIEVGINVPNATVMVIEDANRFGLAQLHQLRGRVGRGEWQSYCIFIDGSEGEQITRRLEVVRDSTDGFHIASEDLKLRGPGDFYGIRQSGDLNFSLADIYQDADVMQAASEDVGELQAHMARLTPAAQKAIAAHMAQKEEIFYTNL